MSRTTAAYPAFQSQDVGHAISIGIRSLIAASCITAANAGATPTFNVFNASELRAAIAAAGRSGAQIRMYPGEYGQLSLTSRRYTGRLTLIAATAERPVFTGMNLSGSSNVSVVGVQVSGAGSPVVQLSGTSRIIFANNHVTGVNRNRDPWDDGNAGLHVRFAQNIVISNNIFEDVRSSVFVQRSAGVTVEHNTLRFVREGMNIAAVNDLRITDNYFHNFFPRSNIGEHPDAIQFWTSNEAVGSTDVTIARNVMMFGGCRSIQGIFIRSETENRLDVPQIRHARFLIEQNVYYGSSRNGLSVSSVDHATVRNNVVVGSPYAFSGISRAQAQASDIRCSGALVPGILSRFGSATHAFANNVTHVLGSTAGTRYNDVSITTDSGTGWEDLLDARPTSDVPALREFVTRSPSLLRTRGVGLLATYPHGYQMWTPDQALGRGLSLLR